MGKLLCMGGVVLLAFAGCSVASDVDKPDAGDQDAYDGSGADDVAGGDDGGGQTDETACQDECTEGERFCDGNAYRVCGQMDADSCVEWSDRIDCAAGETCLEGSCNQNCQDDCTFGTRRCTDNYSYETCNDYDGDSCYEWGALQSCGAGLVCDEGQCVVSCSDACSLGERQCLGATSYQVCGNYDSDSCLEWGGDADCPGSMACELGQCVQGCSDECTLGQLRCAAGIEAVESCGNFDGDACAEWGGLTPCVAGEVCDAGDCVQTCTDECTLGDQACMDGVEAVISCADHDGDTCTEWGGQVDCIVGQVCDADTATCIDPVDPCSIENIVAAINQQQIYDTLEELTNNRRYTFAEQQAAVDLMETRLTSYGVDYSFHTYSWSGSTHTNIEITIPGTQLPDEIYLAGGHYDSVSAGVGADDNASGTSGVIEVARVLANCQYKRTIKLVLFSNEERGVVGSANYAEDAAANGDDILGMYGVDMIGYGPSNEDLDACTKVADAFLAHAVETASNLYVGLPIYKDIDDQCG